MPKAEKKPALSTDEKRFEILGRALLLNREPSESFDSLTKAAVEVLGIPVSLVSLIDTDRQFFKSAVGLKEPWASQRQTPLSHSFCKTVVARNEPLILSDATKNDEFKDNRAITELGVIAYAGFPIVAEGEALGAFCAIDVQPRVWSESELKALRVFAGVVSNEIELALRLRKLEETNAVYHAVMESIAEGVLVTDQSGQLAYSNLASKQILNLESNASELPLEIRQALEESLVGGEINEEISLPMGDGDPRIVSASARAMRGDHEILAAVCVLKDVTKQREQAMTMHAIVENLPQMSVVMINRDLHVIAANGELLEHLNFESAGLVGTHVLHSVASENVASFHAWIKTGFALTPNQPLLSPIELTHHGVRLRVRLIPLFGHQGEVRRLLFVSQDISVDYERSRLLEMQANRLQEEAISDELTGLNNRRGFLLLGEQQMKNAIREKASLVLIFVDLNGMKTINDVHGHEVGDLALIDTAKLLRKTLREADIVARLGGDEFVVLSKNVSVPGSIALEQKIQTAVRVFNEEYGAKRFESARPSDAQKRSESDETDSPRLFELSLSLGIAHFDPEHPRSLADLMVDADEKMYAQKKKRYGQERTNR